MNSDTIWYNEQMNQLFILKEIELFGFATFFSLETETPGLIVDEELLRDHFIYIGEL